MQTLKIVSWNCSGGFRKKFRAVQEYSADIYIIQECEDPILHTESDFRAFSQNHLWVGNNKNKGLGVFARPGILLEKLDWTNIFEDHTVNYFLPVKINRKYKLVGVWAHRNNSPTFGYIGQFWKYLLVNEKNIEGTIFLGDFNSNSIWDRWDRWWNHKDVVNILRAKNIESVYHVLSNEVHGTETRHTFFLHKNPEKAYHIDYCFMPRNLIESLKSFEIARFEEWKPLSDHSPLLVTFG